MVLQSVGYWFERFCVGCTRAWIFFEWQLARANMFMEISDFLE